jgi:predicted Zn-dependent protease
MGIIILDMRLAAFILFSLTLLAQNSPFDPEGVGVRQLAENARELMPRVECYECQDYVAKLGARLAAQFPSPAVADTFSVVSVSRTNALHEPVVLPGDYVLVPVSLLLAANDEAEFAGMLAQSISGPVLVKHNPTGKVPITFLDSFGGDLAMPAAGVDRRREIESKADELAIPAISRAGFDPAAFLRYIERLQPSDRLRSPFPIRATRIAALQTAIGELPPGTLFRK